MNRKIRYPLKRKCRPRWPELDELALRSWSAYQWQSLRRKGLKTMKRHVKMINRRYVAAVRRMEGAPGVPTV